MDYKLYSKFTTTLTSLTAQLSELSDTCPGPFVKRPRQVKMFERQEISPIRKGNICGDDMYRNRDVNSFQSFQMNIFKETIGHHDT